VTTQTITFPAITTKEVGQPEFILTANSTSGLPISYSVVSGGIKINESTVSITAPGPVKIKASQPGNNTFFPATPIEADFCINPTKPTIEINSPSPDNFTLTSSSDSNNNWLKNDEVIAGAKGKTYEVLEEGIYSVKVDYSGCSNTSLPTLFKITGLNEAILSNNAYPNPTEGPISLTWPYSNGNLKKVQLFDLHGKSSNITFQTEGQLVKMDISGFLPGLYVLQLHTDMRAITLKVLKE
jgi:hypothetical protein